MWERLIEPDEMESWTPEGKLTEEDTQTGQYQGQDYNDLKNQIKQKWLRALENIRPKDPSQPPGYELIDLDIRITAGSSMPTNRIARQEVGMEMGQLIGQVSPVDGIEYEIT